MYDRLKELNLPAVSVNFATKAKDTRVYAQTRSELWGRMKEWLVNDEPEIPNDRGLIKELKQQEYGYNNRMQIQLLSKKHMKAAGLASPDTADALATTFYPDVQHAFSPKVSVRPIVHQSSIGWT